MVIAGKDKGEVASIARVLPRENRVLLEGLNLVKRHRRPTQRNRKGQIIDKPMSMHASNVQLVDPKDGKPTRIKFTRKDGERVRVAVKSGQELK